MKRYAIGIDLGGTAVKFGVVDSLGEVLYSGKLPTLADQGREVVIGQILKGVERALDYAKEAKIGVIGVGIGTPGIVSEDEKVVLGGAENLPEWENLELAKRIEEVFDLKCWLNNDANMMALAETRFGAAKGSTDVVFLTVGTGIGGGVLIGGELYGGYKNRGTEFGHIVINCAGEECNCGGVGCLEHYASTSALVRDFKRTAEMSGVTFDEECNGELIVKLYHEGNSLAKEVLNRHWDYLGFGITSIIHIFSPERVVVGGGISEAGEFYLEELRRRVERYAMKECSLNTKIVGAKLGNGAGTLGAAALVFSHIR